MSITLEMPESVKDKVDELIATYVKHAGKRPDFLRMNGAMYKKLHEEIGLVWTPNGLSCHDTYNGIFISVSSRMPEGVVDAGEWA